MAQLTADRQRFLKQFVSNFLFLLFSITLETMSDSGETETKTITLRTAGFDARFPNTNQTKHCWQNYVDYFKCIKARGEDFAPCQQFFRAYHSLCPTDYISKWDTQREEGNFPVNLSP